MRLVLASRHGKWSNGPVQNPMWSEFAGWIVGDLRVPFLLAGIVSWSVARRPALRAMGWTAFGLALAASTGAVSSSWEWFQVLPSAPVVPLVFWALVLIRSRAPKILFAAAACLATAAVAIVSPPLTLLLIALSVICLGAGPGRGVESFLAGGSLTTRWLMVVVLTIVAALAVPAAGYQWGVLGGGLCAGLLTERRVGERFQVRSAFKDHAAKTIVGVAMVVLISWFGRDWRDGAPLVLLGAATGVWWIGGVPFLARAPEYPPEGGAPPL